MNKEIKIDRYCGYEMNSPRCRPLAKIPVQRASKPAKRKPAKPAPRRLTAEEISDVVMMRGKRASQAGSYLSYAEARESVRYQRLTNYEREILSMARFERRAESLKTRVDRLQTKTQQADTREKEYYAKVQRFALDNNLPWQEALDTYKSRYGKPQGQRASMFAQEAL